MGWNPDLNMFVCVGRICSDVTLKVINDTDVINFDIACKSMKENISDFFHVSVWGKSCKALNNILAKGKQIALEGRLGINKYTAKDGTLKEKIGINANKVQLLSFQPKIDNNSTKEFIEENF